MILYFKDGYLGQLPVVQPYHQGEQIKTEYDLRASAFSKALFTGFKASKCVSTLGEPSFGLKQ